MVNDIKEDMCMQLNEFRGDIYKWLTEQLNEIKKKMQDIKKRNSIKIQKFWKNRNEILEICRSLGQIKISVERISIRLDQNEDRILGLYSDKDFFKNLKSMNGTFKTSGTL